MDYVKRLEKVAVLGAAGKMGSGIVWLMALEMFRQKQWPANQNRSFDLVAMDVSATGLQGLKEYLLAQAEKWVGKKPEKVVEWYQGKAPQTPQLAEKFCADLLALVRFETQLQAAADAGVVFEAVSENPKLKVKLFQSLESNNADTWYFSNTSSVPIQQLDTDAKLNGRVLGFHFYNPPAVQKLVELILPLNPAPQMEVFALQLAKNLGKTVVPSNDIAGFIGNGFFMRDALYGIQEALRLAHEMPFPQAVYSIDKITRELLIRPMGIFQLIDYVGIDVMQYILAVMNPHMKDENLQCDLLNDFLKQGLAGGQNPDGSQKDGFFHYQSGKPIAVFDLPNRAYVSFPDIQDEVGQRLGAFPKDVPRWKAVIGQSQAPEILAVYMESLMHTDSMAARLARAYLIRIRQIGLQLVAQGVARQEADVNEVMRTGFFHAYGPIHQFLK